MKLKERKEHVINRVNELSDRYILGELSTEELREYGELRRELEVIINRELVEVDRIKAEKSREMRNRRKRGKATERKIAKDIGGKRRAGVGQEDVAAGMFSIETKHVRHFMTRMEAGLNQAFRLKGNEQIALYVEKCGREARVYLNWRDWLDLHGSKAEGK